MNRDRRQVLGGLAGGAALLALGACAGIGVDPPRVFLEDIRPLGGGALAQRFGILLRVQNPNRSDLVVTGANFDLYLNDVFFASGVSNQVVTVPALASATIEAEATTSIVEAIAQILALSQTRTLSYELDGRLFLDGGFGGVGFEQYGSYELTGPLGHGTPIPPARPRGY